MTTWNKCAFFASRWRDEHRGKWFTVPKLVGFCLLLKRELYDKIGGLDERFGIGFFDDDDLAERARRAGFELAVAHDLFVHHFGSRTFAGDGMDAENLLDENARRFAAKWGLPGTNGKSGRLEAVRRSPFPDSRLAEEVKTVSVVIRRPTLGVSPSVRSRGEDSASRPYFSSRLCSTTWGVRWSPAFRRHAGAEDSA